MSEINKTTPENNQDDKKKISRRGLLAGLGVLGLGAAGGAVGVAVSRNNGGAEKPSAPKPVDGGNKPPEQKPEPVEEEPVVDPYEAQAWGGIEPGLEGEKLVEALTMSGDLTPEQAAEKFANNINYLLMGDCTPEEAKKYADIDPYTYLMNNDFAGPLINGMEARKKAIVEAAYVSNERDEYTIDTPFEISGVDNQVFNGMMFGVKALYCASYNDETATEPFKIQFEPIHSEVTDDESMQVTVNVITNTEKSGDMANELIPPYIQEGLFYDLGDRATITAWLTKDTPDGNYRVQQPELELN